ncbi:hypothetical protein HZU77_016630, partial [Neisseriaceae bacterium TC5R-5]|nr:hypothetical protein [Neisseriaceae bacterium TC5R-5]
MSQESLASRWPAVIHSYDPARRLCRIQIPSVTDGGDGLPEAEIEYPIGDKSRSGAHTTEIDIQPGDPVWIAFIGGDTRYPIITGYRNPQVGNSQAWRRWHHANIELDADTQINLLAGGGVLIKTGTVVIQAQSIKIDAPETTCTG